MNFLFLQSEQKKFLQQHKQRSETYSKAAATMKKQRKKNKGTTKTGIAMDKELKVSSLRTVSKEMYCAVGCACAVSQRCTVTAHVFTTSNQLICFCSFVPSLIPCFPFFLHLFVSLKMCLFVLTLFFPP
jgi:hypothetical protein